MSDDTVFLVPRRADNGRRDKIWEWVKNWWSERFDFPIYEGHHNEGPFSRSAAVNTAARLAGNWKTAILLDSDVFVDVGQVKDGLELAKVSETLVHPFRSHHSLNQGGSDQIMNGFTGSWVRWIARTQLDNISACVIVPRKVWDVVGGFDERFQGWGFEDSAFCAAADSYFGNHMRISGELWHLWHEKSPESDSRSPLLVANRTLMHRYNVAKQDPDEIKALLHEPGAPLA
jgi:GT2 family glycosyltransferase